MRLLLRPPALAVLDESTSALDAAGEAAVYALVASCGVTVISLGHRASLVGHHHQRLTLLGGGDWELEDLDGPQ